MQGSVRIKFAAFVGLAMIVSLSSVIPLLVGNRGQIWITGDGPVYLRAAQDLFAGAPIDWFSPWPIGYPTFLSLGFHLRAVEPFISASQALVGIGLSLASIRFARLSGLRRVSALMVGLLVALSPALYDTTRFLYADGLFSLLCSVSILLIATGLQSNHRVISLLASGLCISAASMVKDLGFTLILPLMFALVISVARKLVSPVVVFASFALALLGPTMGWLRRNQLGVGDRGLAFAEGWPVERIISHLLQWNGGILVPVGISRLALFFGLVVLVLFSLSPILSRQGRLPLTVAAVFVTSYFGFWSVYLFTSGHHDFEWRYMLPIFPFVVIGVAVSITCLLRQLLSARSADTVLFVSLGLWVVTEILRLPKLWNRSSIDGMLNLFM